MYANGCGTIAISRTAEVRDNRILLVTRIYIYFKKSFYVSASFSHSTIPRYIISLEFENILFFASATLDLIF